jgi:hypothetical protein
LFTNIPNLTIKHDNRIIGVLSKRDFDSLVDAEAREAELFAIAAAVLGRPPSVAELHRGFVPGHPTVPRRDRPRELRWAGVSVQREAPQTREAQIRTAIQQIRERTEQREMTTREKIDDVTIRKLKAELAELEAEKEREARLNELQKSADYRTRRDAVEVFGVVAAFDLDAPSHEMDAVKLMRDALASGDFDEFDRYAVPFRERLDAHQTAKLAKVNAATAPALRAVSAVSAALGAK